MEWKTAAGCSCKKMVSEENADAWLKKIRGLPDVKTSTVRLTVGK